MDRKELINWPRRKNRRNGSKKFVFLSKWDPRGPKIHNAVKSFENILYMHKANGKSFPPGSLITDSEDKRMWEKLDF